MSGSVSHAQVAEDLEWTHCIDVLSLQECEHWQAEVLALRKHWTARNAQTPFFTLGLAAYLDAMDIRSAMRGKTLYQSALLRGNSNQLLLSHFKGLLDACIQVISTWQQQVVKLAPQQYAVPGFHIHMPHPVFRHRVASKHFDLQFRNAFPNHEFANRDVLTFTLPISVPQGSGVHLWGRARDWVAPYKAGQMFLHSGLLQHQAVLHPQGGEQARIMLQGHGVRIGNEWILYW